MSEILRLEHLEKSFGDHKVLRDINMTVNKGDVISVIGPSGSGKEHDAQMREPPRGADRRSDSL